MTTTACDDQYAPDTSARDELLDKLAMEYQKFPGLIHEISWVEPITEQDWLQRREELINCPPDSEAPDNAEWKCQDGDGGWTWFESKPYADYDVDEWLEEDEDSIGLIMSSRMGKIPAGHDWRTTLTRINRDDNTSTPEEESEFERIQARIDSEKPYEADARMLDAQLMSSFASFGVTTKQARENMAANIKALHEYDRISEGYSDAQLERDIETFREAYKIAEDECAKAYGKPNANSILNAAAQHMQDRAATYDKPEGERSMAATVDAFRATTGIELTEEQGWHFMALLKLVRSQQGEYRADSYEDGVSYVALAGEAAAKERNK